MGQPLPRRRLIGLHSLHSRDIYKLKGYEFHVRARHVLLLSWCDTEVFSCETRKSPSNSAFEHPQQNALRLTVEKKGIFFPCRRWIQLIGTTWPCVATDHIGVRHVTATVVWLLYPAGATAASDCLSCSPGTYGGLSGACHCARAWVFGVPRSCVGCAALMLAWAAIDDEL